MGKFLSGVVCAVAAWLSFFADAASVSFKPSSVLSSGKWVKVKVEKTGIYELSYDDLKSYGFTNPENVKVFGTGGNVASENYLYKYMDDLEQVPIMRSSDKLYFYGKGIVRDSLVVAGDSFSYKPITNPYSRYGVYFLSDIADENTLLVEDADKTKSLSEVGDAVSDRGFAVWCDEKELYNPGLTGQSFLGNSIVVKKGVSYSSHLPDVTDDGTVYVTMSTAMVGNSKMSASIQMNGVDMGIVSGGSLAKNSTVEYLEYGILVTKAKADASELGLSGGKMNLKYGVATTGSLLKGWVDFVSVVYPAYNSLPSDSSQTRRFVRLKKDEGVRIGGITPTTMVWKVDEYKANTELPYMVQNCVMRNNGDGTADFAEGKNLSWAEYVIFDTSKPQMKPTYLCDVENQNLHAIESPDMLIITNSILRNQAVRLAAYHREHDGMDVIVVDQQQIFNEFSSGVRDAMGYRRFCKMLYDRNPEKFQYLLLFGDGTYDNRMIFNYGSSESLLTYQSKDSNSQSRSYSSDDFFGILDNSSTVYTSRKLSIAVGRIPFASEKDASAYVDKLLSYGKDSGDSTDLSWRNNMLLVGENGDADVHVEQCESFQKCFNETGSYDMNVDKLYIGAFSENKNVRTKFVEKLGAGQNFVLFVGHGNPVSLTKTQVLMTLDEAKGTYYKHLPLMYFSTCDVGRFDNGASNMVSELLANRNGGLIAAVASTRVVYTHLNGVMSDSFAKSLSKSEDYYGGDKTIGKVLMDAKNNSDELTINRMKYHVIGDPAFRIGLPENRVKVEDVDGIDVTEDGLVKVALNDEIKLKGYIDNGDGAVATNFNGSIVAKLYDSSDKKYMTITGSSDKKEVLEKCGAELSSSKSEVASGRFSLSLLLPGFSISDNETIPVRLIALDNEGNQVSGSCLSVVAGRGLDSGATVDTEVPMISSMYIGDEGTFKDGMTVEPDFVITARVEDNVGINTSTETITSKMLVSFDGGKDSRLVNKFIHGGSDGGFVEIPVYDMKEGRHTAELQVSDYAGNLSRRTISFIVEPSASNIELDLDNRASAECITVGLKCDAGIIDYSDAELVVSNDFGDILFRQRIGSFPYDWNLTDNDGNRLSDGDYNMYAIIDGQGTPIEKIVVLKQ